MMTNNYSREERYRIANTIWQTLGSQRFSLVTGCEPIVYGERDGMVYLLMKVGRNCHAINRFEVAYDEGKDLFELRFIRKRGEEAYVAAEHKDVYFDMIHTLFSQHTGMVTNLKVA